MIMKIINNIFKIKRNIKNFKILLLIQTMKNMKMMKVKKKKIMSNRMRKINNVKSKQ